MLASLAKEPTSGEGCWSPAKSQAQRVGLFYLRLGLFHLRLAFVAYENLLRLLYLRLKFSLVFLAYGGK